MQVAVCDDNSAFLREAQAMLQQEQRIERVALYTDPEDLLEDIACGRESFDMILMDIDFDTQERGIQSAGQICRLLPDVEILYVTAYNDRFSQNILLGDAQPMGYLVKPVQPERLRQYIDKFYRKRGSRAYLTLSIRGQDYSISADSIRYMESRNHTVRICMDGEELLAYDKLDAIFARLPPVFARCHKSYVVNLKRICRLDPDRAYLADGTAIPVSRAKRAQLREAFFRLIGEELV
ncbi:MAG: LytTR family DNA-binding domain-containing protein [Firmicutes bacterium]|nr:LytTR family DNA-binding domain-containing protein [Bacillota bacterium]